MTWFCECGPWMARRLFELRGSFECYPGNVQNLKTFLRPGTGKTQDSKVASSPLTPRLELGHCPVNPYFLEGTLEVDHVS